MTAHSPPELQTETIVLNFDWIADFVAPGFGVFLGVIAGALVTFGLTLLLNRMHKRQRVQALATELRLNIQTLELFLKDIQKLRNAVNANAVATYHGYFALAKLLFVTADEMLRSGLLYKHLVFEEISTLQRLSRDFSFLGGEQTMNMQITQLRTSAQQGQFNQEEAKLIVDIWEDKFVQAKDELESITDKLMKSRQ